MNVIGMTVFAQSATSVLRYADNDPYLWENAAMFDFSKFLEWVQGGLLNSAPTWQIYKEEAHSWKATAIEFSAPLIVAWGVLAVILGYVFGTGSGFSDFLVPLISSALWFGIGSLIASFLASKFGGKDSFDQAFAALTFASIPGVLGNVLGAIPWIGFLLALAGGIWSLMLLWQSLPVFLDITLERRTGHFFATLGLSFVALLISALLLGALGLGRLMYSVSDASNSDSPNPDLWSYDGSNKSSGTVQSRPSNQTYPSGRISGPKSNGGGSGSDVFGLGREIDYLEQAGEDRYTPPLDGKVNEEQLERTIKFFAATERLRDDSTSSLEKLKDKNNEPSLGDLFKGVKGLVNAGTAEMQAVKSGGGNWAEHEWIKKQLFDGKIHQDLNDITAHNYQLYQDNAGVLDNWL